MGRTTGRLSGLLPLPLLKVGAGRGRKNRLTLGILKLDNHYNGVTCTLPFRNIYYLEPGVRCLLPGELWKQRFICAAIIEDFI